MAHLIPATIDGILDEAQAQREAAALHEALNGLRSKLALEGPAGEPGPSDAEVMEEVEGPYTLRTAPTRMGRAAA